MARYLEWHTVNSNSRAVRFLTERGKRYRTNASKKSGDMEGLGNNGSAKDKWVCVALELPYK
jgi:hypothetical protein